MEVEGIFCCGLLEMLGNRFIFKGVILLKILGFFWVLGLLLFVSCFRKVVDCGSLIDFLLNVFYFLWL